MKNLYIMIIDRFHNYLRKTVIKPSSFKKYKKLNLIIIMVEKLLNMLITRREHTDQQKN